MTGCTEPTFTSYNAADASSYAQGRASSYPSALYHQILAFAGIPLPSRNKSSATLLDVGCGTGQATRDLAPQFARVVATDPSPEMIEEARKRDYRTGTGEVVEFTVKCAEECDEIDGLDSGSVDVVVAAMAAHWFDMARFWKSAGAVLKPGGVVAVWTCASLYAHPSTPNHAQVQRILFKLERDTLAPYELPGNRLSRDMYASLPLPWDVNISLPFSLTPSAFRRVEWDTDGLPSAPSGEYLSGEAWTTLDDLQRSLGTASMVTRWREDPRNRGEEDVVVSAMRELRLALGEGVPRIKTGSGTVLLLLKKDG